MANDDDALLVHHDRLAKTKLSDRLGDGIDGSVVDSRVIRIGFDSRDSPHFDSHGLFLSAASAGNRHQCRMSIKKAPLTYPLRVDQRGAQLPQRT
jgi:hypothetical protein